MALATVSSLNLDCFHCGLSVPAAESVRQTLNGQVENFCCPGCAAVAAAIHQAGLDNYYTLRTEKGRKANPDTSSNNYEVYDHPSVQQSFVRELGGGGLKEATLVLEGITCAACVWLIEKHLSKLAGVENTQLNYSNHQAIIEWNDSQIKLSRILREISHIGYSAHPYDPNRRQALLNHERKQFLRRIGVAAALGMQVMILSVALYAGDWWGMETEFRDFFRRIGLLLTTGVLIYSGQVFYKSAWRDISLRRLGMDVPIALGLSVAFIASTWATLSGAGDVYFDSVVMFILLVTGARYIELSNRSQAACIIDRKLPLLPASATRIANTTDSPTHEVIPNIELNPGDHILVRPGEVIPADGIIVDGVANVDESILTGESLPLTRSVGEKVIAGSVNIDNPFTACVLHVGQDTILSGIERLLHRAQYDKSTFTQLTDKIAAYFVAGVLTIAALVAAYWWWQGNDIWLQATIAVLIVSCPCALSLATPTAIAAAGSKALKEGILITRQHALEALQSSTHFVFDKTGTLTEGNIVLDRIQPLSDLSQQQCLELAAALELHSEHPLAKAIVSSLDSPASPNAKNIQNTPGAGIKGEVNEQTYVIGRPSYVSEQLNASTTKNHDPQTDLTTVVLATPTTELCLFTFRDEIRSDTETTIQSLKEKGINVVMLTGDRLAVAKTVAQQSGVENVFAECTPERKLEIINTLGDHSTKTVMIGDGINDAPAMGGADVSIAMGDTANITSVNADILLINKKLSSLNTAHNLAIKTHNIIRQNVTWAIAYNIVAIPLAAAGYVQPWLAAIGMSASSIIVVLNASRLLRGRVA